MRHTKTHIETDENGKVISIETVSNFANESAKVEKIGGVNKANRMVKARMKCEIVESQILGRIDLKDKRRNERKAKKRKVRIR